MAKTLDDSAGDMLAAMDAFHRQNQRADSFVIGQVLVGSQEGLVLQANGLPITANQIWINEALLAGYSPKLVGQLPGTCPDGGTMTPVTKDQLTRGEFALKAGDRVVLLTQDEQSYYLICKVVRLG